MSTVFITGASGYIGGAIARELAAVHRVKGGVRRLADLPSGIQPVVTGDLADARLDFTGVDAVVHAAGLGHRRGVSQVAWRRANLDAAVNVAAQAKAAGVRRLVLISTAHVHGRVHAGRVGDATAFAPADAYAESKLLAERAVAAVFGEGLSILRPVAVIGPGCPGNLQPLMRLLRRGLPLPFGALTNRRSFIAVADLARLVALVLASTAPPPMALAASPQAIATPALIRALARGMDVPARLLPAPPALLGAVARLLGRGSLWQSLSGDFLAEPRAALDLGWQPRASLEQALEETGRVARQGFMRVL